MRSTLVFSDVHLSTVVRDPGSWMPYRRPEALSDPYLARTLDRAVEVAERRRSELEIVLAGDVLDPDAPPTEHTSSVDHRAVSREAKGATWIVDRILDDHPEIVQALGRALRRGHRVVILPGNHDAQIAFPEVKEILFQRLQHASASLSPVDVLFRSWLHQTHDGIVIEHGHGYDPFCVMERMEPIIRAGRSVLEDTLGSLATHHVSALVENPYAADATAGAGATLASRLCRDSRAFGRVVQAVQDVITAADTAFDPTWIDRVSLETGLDREALFRHRRLFTEKATVAWLLSLASGDYRYGEDVDRRLQSVMPRIAELHGARGVVMGHTHQAFGLSIADRLYANSGTWAPLGPSISPSDRVGTFVWLRSGEDKVTGALYAVLRNGETVWIDSTIEKEKSPR